MISGHRPGYLDGRWTSWVTGGIRHKADATQLPLPSWLHAFFNADPAPEGPVEGGEPTPVMLAALARKHRQAAHRSTSSASLQPAAAGISINARSAALRAQPW